MKRRITRRSFICHLGGAMGLFAAGLAYYDLFSQTNPSKRTLKKAVNLGMVAQGETILEKFEIMQRIGFDGVEINYPAKVDLKEIKDASARTGLKVANIMNSGHWQYPLSDPRPEIRSKGIDCLNQAIEAAKILGSPTVLLVPAVVTKEVAYDQAYQRSQTEIKKIAPVAEKAGIKIGIENVWNQFLLSPLEAARYVDEIGSPAVGWHFDVGNIVNYGWPEQWIKILGKRIVNVHVKEFSRKKRDQNGLWKGFEVELIEGDCDWKSVMKAFDEIGYNGWLIAEIPGGDGNRLKDIFSRMSRIIES